MTAPGNPFEGVRYGGATGRPAYRKTHTMGKQEGFTILEILLSMTLTCLGILCLGGLLKAIGEVEAEDTWATKALFCAQERMEELKFGVATGNVSTTEKEEVVAEGSYQGMGREWTVGASSIFDGLLEVRVECTYPWKGTTKTVGLSTLVFSEG